MSARRATFEMLNAYVDGELDTATAAEVAKAVAEDPALAREVAALSRLRSAVAESLEAPPLSLPAPPSGKRRGLAIAASIAFVAFVAGSVAFSTFHRDSNQEWLARAWQMHHGWSHGGVTAQARATVLLATYADVVPGAYVPDLSASRLSLVHSSMVTLNDQRPALLAGYRGTRGCKISLLVFASPETLGESLSAFHDGGHDAYGWRAGTLGYLILSDGMDPERFRLLAKSVRETSREHAPFNRQTRLALRESRDQSEPCVT